MKVLAIDIGAGTEDILLYDDNKSSVENCIKMVLPSPCQLYAAKVRKSTVRGENLFVKGDTIGGGPFSNALKRHVESGLRVYMTEEAAYTVRNNLDQVRKMGIEIVPDSGIENFDGKTIGLEEVNINSMSEFLGNFGESFSDIDFVAVAVQDHGSFSEDISNRKIRISNIRELLEENPRPEAFAFAQDEIPQYYLRMQSAAKAARRQLPNATVIIMDTSPDAIIGCLIEPEIKKLDRVLAVNVGNGHTMAAIIVKDEIVAVLEHHTGLLESAKMEKMLIDFADGKLTDQKIFDDNGHGMFYLKEPPGFSDIQKIVVTGPNRKIFEQTDLPVHFATPGGDVMMSGTFGLVEAIKRKFP